MEGPTGLISSSLLPQLSTSGLETFKLFLSSQPALETLLVYDDLIDYTVESESLVKDYLFPNHIPSLLDFLLTMPGETASVDRCYKFPFISSQLLSSKFCSFLDEINDDKNSLYKILEFLNSDDHLNGVLCRYFSDICENLLSRDKLLMKIIAKDKLEWCFNHIGNRKLNFFYSMLLSKSCNSEKFSWIVEKIILKFLPQPNESISLTAQEVLTSCLAEDEVYQKIKKNFELFFEKWESLSQTVKKNNLKIIKSFLEKERDLKFIDEDSWGSPETVEIIEKYSWTLGDCLKTNENTEILTSFQKPIKKIGEVCFIAVEVVGLLVDMRRPAVSDLIKNRRFFESIFSIFESHQLSSMFHNIFTNFIITCLNSDLNLYFSLLLFEFLQKIFNENSAHFEGFLANCYKSASILINLTENHSVLRESLVSQSGWVELEIFIREKMKFNSNLME